MKLSDLSPNPQNPRKITDDKLKMLKASLDNFGDLSGIVFNRTSQTLSGGHQRLKCLPPDSEIVITSQYAEKNKQGTVAVGFVFIDGERYSYREVEWDELTEKAANLAANTHGGEWDNKQRIEWLLELEANNYPIEITGLDKEEQEDLMAPFRTMPEGLTDADEVPEPTETRIQVGDVYSLGNHRLMCGDSTKAENVAILMNGEKADMVFTDPPYGIAYDNAQRWAGTKKQNQNAKINPGKMIIGDDVEYDPSFLLEAFSYCKEIFLWGMQYYLRGLPNGGVIVWNRKTREQEECPFADFELCWSKTPRNAMAWIVWGGWISKEKGEERLHTTQKPISLAEWFFERWGKDAKLIVDLYLGSGSTLIACEKTNRKCYGMEIDPQYVQVILDRWEAFTGKKATKLENYA